VDEHGHGRLGDGGEIIGDVLLTGVEGVSTGGNMAKNSSFVQRQPVLELGWVWYAREVVHYGRVQEGVFLLHSKRIVVPRLVVSQAGELVTRFLPGQPNVKRSLISWRLPSSWVFTVLFQGRFSR
jgi:hypothetical protein